MEMTRRRGLALVLGLACSACSGGSELAAVPVQAASLTAGSGLRATDDIVALDLLVDADDAVHVAWVERFRRAGSGDRARIVYRRGAGEPLHWSAPIAVPADPYATVKLVATDDGMHLFVGPRLDHWFLPAQAPAMRSKGRLLDGGDALPRADALDAAATDDGIALVFRGSPGRDGSVLHALRIPATGAPSARPVAPARPGTLPGRAAPRLVRDGSRLLALWAETVPASHYDPTTRATVLETTGVLRGAWSADGGAGWTSSAGLAAGPRVSASAIAATRAGGQASVSFADHGVFTTRLGGDHWGPVVQLGAGDDRSRPGITDVRALASTTCAGRVAVAWADARYRHTDRRWWNPLGGIPWSDNPDWADNDVFLIRDLPADPVAAARAVPERLTASGSFTSDLGIAPHGDGLLLVRAGRARVRKSREDAGAAPEVTVMRVPCG